MLKLTTDRHEASRGLFATAELLALLVTQATDLSLRAIKCCSVVFGVTLRLLFVINISSSYPAINKRRRLITTNDKCHNLRER